MKFCYMLETPKLVTQLIPSRFRHMRLLVVFHSNLCQDPNFLHHLVAQVHQNELLDYRRSLNASHAIRRAILLVIAQGGEWDQDHHPWQVEWTFKLLEAGRVDHRPAVTDGLSNESTKENISHQTNSWIRLREVQISSNYDGISLFVPIKIQGVPTHTTI